MVSGTKKNSDLNLSLVCEICGKHKSQKSHNNDRCSKIKQQRYKEVQHGRTQK